MPSETIKVVIRCKGNEKLENREESQWGIDDSSTQIESPYN